MASNVIEEVIDPKGEEDESQQDTEVKSKTLELSLNPTSSTSGAVNADVPPPEPTVTIQLNKKGATACFNAAEGINSITLQIWLRAVNKNISNSSLAIMKLSFLGDRNKVPYRALDEAKQPSDIFNALAEHLGSKKVAVQRFSYALKRLGHRRMGYDCVREYRKKVGEDPPPKFDVRNESESFGFCQCLSGICVKIQEDVSQALIQYCGPLLLSTNPENIPSLANMLTDMYLNKLITPHDQKKFAIALTIVKAYDCIDCIHKYRLKYTLPPLVIEQHEVQRAYDEAISQAKRDTASSSGSSSLISSRWNHMTTDSMASSPSQRMKELHLADTWDYISTHQGSEGDCISSQAVCQPPLHDRPSTTTPKQHVSCKTFILTVAITLLLVGGTITMMTFGILPENPLNKEIITYDNTTTVVASFTPLSTKEFTLQSRAEFDMKTQYYEADSCSNFPSLTTHSTISGNMSLPPKMVGYFLKGSVLSFKICSAADVKIDAQHAIQFYILNNLWESTTKPPQFYESPTRHWKIKVGYNANVVNQSEPGPGWICSEELELMFSVSKESYYEVLVFPPSIPQNVEVKYWYQSNITHIRIQRSGLVPLICPNDSGGDCTIHVRNHRSFQKHCVFVHIEKIHEALTEDAYMRIAITFKSWYGPYLLIFLSFVPLLIVIVSFVALICKKQMLSYKFMNRSL